MNCPYCGKSDEVILIGVPSVKLLVALGPVLGLGVKCPRHECGHKCEETEHYGEIDH